MAHRVTMILIINPATYSLLLLQVNKSFSRDLISIENLSASVFKISVSVSPVFLCRDSDVVRLVECLVTRSRWANNSATLTLWISCSILDGRGSWRWSLRSSSVWSSSSCGASVCVCRCVCVWGGGGYDSSLPGKRKGASLHHIYSQFLNLFKK